MQPWPQALYLRLPDTNHVADNAPAAIITNGWNEYVQQTLEADDFREWLHGALDEPTRCPKRAIREPSETVVFVDTMF